LKSIALHWAAERGNMDVVLFLLQCGSISVAEDERGKNAENLAESTKLKDIIKAQSKKKYICLRFTPSEMNGFAAEISSIGALWERKRS
jgi:hypothetical protein